MKEYKIEFTTHTLCVDYIEATNEEEAVSILNQQLKEKEADATITKVEMLQEYDD